MISIAANALPTPSMKSLAAHVIVTLAHAQADGRAVRLDELASEIGVRKADVRDVVTRLHAEGHVDGLRLRLTMSGLALGAVLASCTLKEPRRREQAIARVA
jgi:transcription initiation factor IIE alpha subunit